MQAVAPGEAVVFWPLWASILGLPRPMYDLGCQASYQGLLSNTWLVKAAAKAADANQPVSAEPKAPQPVPPG